MKFFWIILFVVGFFVLSIVTVGYYLTWQVESDPRQTRFTQGTVLTDLPDGVYTGSAGTLTVGWKGKEFDAANKNGVNLFGEENRQVFPFMMYVDKGITDKDTDVIKIDYSNKRNPWWMRFAMDEIVLVKPGEYLGKVHIKLIPGFPFTVGYFTLEEKVE